MKKIFIPALLLVVSMSSCLKDEPNVEIVGIEGEDPVAINVVAGKSKGAIVTTSTLEKSATGVKLHIKDSSAINGAYDFIANGSDWSQTADSALEWKDITFPAYFYSMHDGESKELNVADGATTLDYEVKDASSTHKDLVFHASKLNAVPIGGTINVFHKHALSKIDLFAATGTNNLYIARVRLVNVDGEGTVTITPVASTAVGASWDNGTSNGADYEYYSIASDKDVQQLKSTGSVNPMINCDSTSSLMIIPQKTTAATTSQLGGEEGTYLEVIYYMTDAEGAPLVGYSSVAVRQDASKYIENDQKKVLYVMGAFPLEYTFSANKQYELTLGLGKAGSTGGKLVVDNYVDKDGNPVSLTDKDGTTTPEIPEVDKGDDILSDGDIDIIVTVQDWEDAVSSYLN